MFEVAVKTGDISACETQVSYFTQEKKDDCYKKTAINLKMPYACNKIKDPDEKSNCIFNACIGNVAECMAENIECMDYDYLCPLSCNSSNDNDCR